MADEETAGRTDTGPNSRPQDDTVAQSGPGIPDDAASEGYDPVADAEEERRVEAHLPTAEEVFPER